MIQNLTVVHVAGVDLGDLQPLINGGEGGSATLRRSRQLERAVPGIPGLRIATYPSGRRTYIYRFRDPVTGRKTCKTLGPAD